MKLGRNYFEGLWLINEGELVEVGNATDKGVELLWKHGSFDIESGLSWQFTNADVIKVNGEYIFRAALIAWRGSKQEYVTHYIFNATTEILTIIDAENSEIKDNFKVDIVIDNFNLFRVDHVLTSLPNPDYPERIRCIKLTDMNYAMVDSGTYWRYH